MALQNLIAKLQKKWASRTAARRAPKLKSIRRLELELLETRDLMAAMIPTIIKVNPPDQGSLTQSMMNPNMPNTIVVQYSEAMDATGGAKAANNPANYTLFGPSNTPVTGLTVTADPSNPTTTFDVTFPNGQVGGAYTLLVKGDQVYEATDTVALAQPGQLVVANGSPGQSTVSTVNAVDGSPILNAVQTYPLGTGLASFGGPPTPSSVVVADFNGDGIADLAIANSQFFGSEVDVFAGKAGGGFSSTPDARLALPTPPGNATFTGALVAFQNTATSTPGFANLAVIDAFLSSNIEVFVNNQAPGTITSTSFGAAAIYNTGATTPVAIVAGNFNNDTNINTSGQGFTDLAIADQSATGGNYNVDFLAGNGDGTFSKNPVALQVGSTGGGGAGLQAPTSLAAGALKNTSPTDLAVGGGNGVVALVNNNIQNAFSFAESAVFNNNTVGGPTNPSKLLSSVSSVAIGNINGDGNNDIVAGSSTSSFIEILDNVGGTLSAVGSKTVSLGPVTDDGNVVGLSFNSVTGLNDIVAANTNANQVTVLQNTSSTGTFSFRPPIQYNLDSNPIALAIAPVYGDANPDIITANKGSVANQGGTFSVLRNNSASVGTFLVSSPLPESLTAQPDAVAVGDLNGDGVTDLVVANRGTNMVSVYLATAPGVYAAPVTYTINEKTNGSGHGNGPVSVMLANLTGVAGQLDIITADQDGYVSILANNGSGVFPATGAVVYAVGSNPTQVVAGNFDGSGHISLAVSHNGGGSAVNARGVTLLLGNGDRTFQAPQEILPNVAATALVAGNFTTTTAGAPLDLAVADDGTGSVALLKNNGKGVFSQLGAEFAVGAHPSALAAADFNRDGLLDVVAVSKDTTNGVQQIAVLLNSASDGFANASYTALPFGFAINSVAVTDVNLDGSPDLVVGLSGSPTQTTSQGAPADANFYVLAGNGDGTFGTPIPYTAGGPAYNTVVAVVSDPLVHVTTFNLISSIVIADLVQNGGFEGKDLNGDQGNILGWQVANAGPNSRGGFYTQTGTLSPLSQTTVPTPTPFVQPPVGPLTPVQLPNPNVNGGQSMFRAMLDQSNQVPIGGYATFKDTVASYAGSNFLYQDVTLPTDPSVSLTFSIDLYIQSLIGFTTLNAADGLFYNNSEITTAQQNTGNDQQVRVDIMDPNQQISSETVYQNIFQTTSADAHTRNFTVTADLSSLMAQYHGQRVRIRIAAVNNMGPLIVGVDNVSLQSKFTDVTPPTFSGQPVLRNPGFIINAQGLTSTTDPTLIGQVADNSGFKPVTGVPYSGGANNIAFVAFSPTNDGTFNQPSDFRISGLSLDPTGKFSVTLPNPVLGLNTVGVEVVDKAGNITIGTPVSFVYQGPSITDWQAIGPGAINVKGNNGAQYATVSGRINAVLVDPTDPTGNTYLVGSDNGGVWKTTDGGKDWTPATDYIFDGTTPINVPIGALGGAVDTAMRNGSPPTNNFVVYAGTGDANPFIDSRAGSGILVSTNGGNSFKIAGNSDVVLAGARISKIVVDPNDTNVAYAAVASGGVSGPGVYKTLDGGLTWSNIFTTASANLANLDFPAGTTMASVTDIVLNPHDSRLIHIGLGNIGLVGVSATAGVWASQNFGVSWTPVVGNGNPNIQNSTLPGARPIINPSTGKADPNSGIFLGRVTLSQASQAFGTNLDISTLYVLISSPPAAVPLSGDNIQFGHAQGGSVDATPADTTTFNNPPTLFGLYKNGGQANADTAWTHVMVRAQSGGPSPFDAPYRDLDLTGVDGSNVGAIIVDPTDPNVVYVGASQEYPFASGPNHGLIRIDTGNMLDTSTSDPITGRFLNSGDDITKRQAAFDGGADGDFDYPDGQGYIGEGVSWLDVSTNAFNNSFGFGGSRIPPNITSVAFDAQNRIVFGTEQGVFRLVYQGTGYDFTSGGRGIVALESALLNPLSTPATPPQSTIQLSAINGNLAIADLTSVAIDPSIPNRYYTTQYNTGASSITNGVNSANTQGQTGFIGIPDGDRVLVGQPDPTSPSGTLNTVYQEFAFGDRSSLVAFQPTSSAQGGATGSFRNLPTTNIGYNDNAGYLPVLAVGSQKVFDNGSGKFFDELLLGTDRIYTTRTSAGDFTQVANNPGDASGRLSKLGGVISAAAIAPTNDNIIYAGTNKGEVFVTTNNGGDFFPERTTGLPTLAQFANLTVNSITVDPVNAMIAYVTFGGVPGTIGGTKGSLVFKTINGGLNWTNITGDLPNVAANTLVDDSRAQPGVGAPIGHLYVATNVGVYVSVNGGAHWAPLGVGLPHVPVIDLQFNTTLEELVAGTQGRGVFQISTDVTGPRAISETADNALPNTPINGFVTPLTSVTVTFDKSIGLFPLSAVISITGPQGQVITPVSVTDVSTFAPGFPNPHTKFQITFASQILDGIYTFKIGPSPAGPGVLDLVGNGMDQNQNGINGEAGDVYTFQVVLNSTDDGDFVTGQYHDELGRPADTTGFINLLAPVDAARQALLQTYAFDYVRDVGRYYLVQDLYGTNPVNPSIPSTIGVGDLLERNPTTSDTSFWLNQFQMGASPEQLILGIIASPEYFAESRINGNDAAFTTTLYQDLLHRPPTAGESTAVVTQLANSEASARTQDARSLLGGQQYQTVFIQSVYNQFLNRNATPDQLQSQLNQFSIGATQEQIIASVLGTTEYYNIDAPNVVGGGATPTNTTLILAMYKQLFPGYTITQMDVNYWLGQINNNSYMGGPNPSGVSAEQMANVLDTLPLYRFGINPSAPTATSNGSLDRAFFQILGRYPDPTTVANLMALYNANPNFRMEDFDASLLGSGEYFADNTTANTPLPSQDKQFVDALYVSQVGATSPVEQIHDLPFLTTAEATARQLIGINIVGSPEYIDKVTTYVYQTDLGRAPTQAELNYWLPTVGKTGAQGGPNGDEQLLDAIFSSPEYFLDQPLNANNLHTNNAWLLSLYPHLNAFVDPNQAAANLASISNAYAPQRLAAIHAFQSSAEHVGKLTTDAYQLYLGRLPTTAEYAYWIGLFQAGETQEQQMAAILSSSEYVNRTPTILGIPGQPTVMTFVDAIVFQLFPGYTLQQSDENVFVTEINNGTLNRLQLAQTLIGSSQYRFGFPAGQAGVTIANNGFIERSYIQYLGRTHATIAQSEIDYWRSVYANNPAFLTTDFLAALFDSQEYLDNPHLFP